MPSIHVYIRELSNGVSIFKFKNYPDQDFIWTLTYILA